ncbi:hypothetical protein [Sphingomonas panacisoli]|uniref:hypothetical protein n=1 Tax=Sphingomonas panacisoli TaxID=1813879 RepID=UPI0030B8662A
MRYRTSQPGATVLHRRRHNPERRQAGNGAGRDIVGLQHLPLIAFDRARPAGNPNIDIALPATSGSSTTSGARPIAVASQRISSPIAMTSGPASSYVLPACAFRIGQDARHGFGDIDDVNRLEPCLGLEHGGPSAGRRPSSRSG